tara:strand:+ start:394 stop:771 length:378 start_codon:yes stop_codon:yes gene_type:complete
MGRYVYGDIEHKFWFATQESNDITLFGGNEAEAQFINWYWDEQDIPVCEDKLKEVHRDCVKSTGISPRHWLSKVNSKGYTLSSSDKETDDETWRKGIEYAATFELGMKIRRVLKDQGSCSVEAEF